MSNVKGPDEAQNPDFEELVAQYQGSVLRMCSSTCATKHWLRTLYRKRL